MRMLCNLSLMIAVLICGGMVHAATVTVDPVGTPSATLYNTLADAVANYATATLWGDGSDDTILIEDTGVHTFTSDVFVPSPIAGTLTIKNAVGASPVFVVESPANTPLWIQQPGDYLVDGLTIIGPAGAEHGRGIMAYANNGATVNVVIQNCLLTANDGSDQPVTDLNLPRPFYGSLAWGIDILPKDGGNLTVSVKDCVVAFASPSEADGGCTVEIHLKDISTVRHEPQRLTEWDRIAKEEAERFGA